ncbi:complement receptor type 1 isoform 5-T5 [Pangshura tecta]
MVFVTTAARPACCDPLRLLGFVLLLLLPGACGQCGALPSLSHATPSGTNHTEGFPISTEVTYKCSAGFVKIPGKSDTVVCLSNSQWSNIEEFCGRSCLAPPRLKSAVLSNEDLRKNYYPVGTNVSYVCRPGYERTELSPVITCLENLTWAEAPEFCLGKSCGVPTSPEHSRLVDATNNRFGARVNILCDDGYRVKGRTFIQCLLKGDQVEWSELPTCELITCSPPPNITNGMHNGKNGESFVYNSSVTYKCDDDFSLTGEASIHCTTKDNVNGVWNGSAPECKVIITTDKPTTVPPKGTEVTGTSAGQCGALPRLSRAVPRDTSRTEGFPIGIQVTYRCLDGFVKIPGKSDTVVCLSNSEWSTFGEFCDGNCSATPRLKSATLSKEDAQKNYSPPGSTVTYDCRPGYESTEVKPVITCLESLTWSEAPEFCRGKSCGVPEGPEHGRAVVITNDLYGARANIICDEGFRLHGRPFIQCLLKRDQVEWSELPTCQGECGALPKLSRAVPRDTSRTEGFPIGAQVTYRCLEGFHKIPGKSDTVVCLSNSEWSTIGEFCNGGCGAPPRLKSATLSKEDGQKNYCPPGSTVTYDCRPGYESTEVEPVVTCLESLTWSESPEFCRGKSCGVPEGPEHGRAVVITNDLYGARANIICDEGFRLHGRPFIQCLLKRDQVEWSQLPTCQGQCGALPRLSRAVPRDSNRTEGFTINEQVTYRCCNGFVKIPGKSDTVVCLSDSEWSTFGEFCDGNCSAPPRLKSATLSKEDGQKNYSPPGSTVTYDCRPGYESTEVKPVITCLESLTWSEAPEFCRGKSCGVPEGPEHGRAVVITNDLYGARANIICDEGFRLHGWPFIQCLLKRDQVEWSELPTCQAQCGALPRLSRAVPRDTSRTEGFPVNEQVTYKCLDGFVKIPGKSDTVVCLSNSEWSTFGEFCDGNCSSSPRLKSATLSKEDGQKNYSPPGSTVTYDCRPGYESTEVKPVITCLENLTWSEAPEFCRGKSCGVPEGPEHGRAVVITNDLYGARANIICDEGFRLHGWPFIQCLLKRDQVEWSELPTCQAQCGALPRLSCAVPRDTSRTEGFPIGTEVTYRCLDGFVKIPGKSDTVVCLSNSEWSTFGEFCDGGCGAPPRLKFATLSKEDGQKNYSPPGTTVTYDCHPGYESTEVKPVITCLENLTWSEAPEFCREKSCGHPGEPENGRVIITDIQFGSTVHFACEEGHWLIGKRYRRCEIYGTRVAWDGEVPICERIPCLPPPDIPNGKHTGVIMDGFFYGSSVTYKCESDYPLTGEASIHCTTKDGLNGEWSARPPRCGEVRCPTPQIQNGRRVSGDRNVYSYKDNVTFECDPGYTMKGHSLSQCQTDDTWDPPLPVCEPVTCISPEVENGRTNGVQPTYRPRDLVVFECDPGFTLSGSPETRCQDDGTWDPPVPVCERMLQCPPPLAITNGKPSIQASAVFTTGTSVNYSCEPGYSLTGQASIYCMASGTWSPPPPRCEEVLCIAPEIQHGRKVAGHGPVYRPRDTVRFECDPGYTLNGSRHIQCRDDRTWDPPVPACVQALPCPPPPVIVNGKHNAKPLAAFPSGTYVNYNCEPDYALRGEASIYCTTSGTWSHPSPLCEEGCGVPTRLSFAELKSEYKNQSSFPVGKTINYTCLPGYSRYPRMQSTLKCLENRTWSEAFEFCKKKSCGHPGEPENGRVIITDLLFGSTVTFTCEEGHRLIGKRYRRCEIYGTRVAWDGEVPICERIPCLPPPDIPNGRHTGVIMDGFFYGSSVTYKCESDYPLTGEASIHCTTKDGLNGEWSARPPRCGEVRCPTPQIQNGRRVSGDRNVYSYKDNVTFECDPGYTMKGHSLSQCQTDDTWDPPLPVCEPATCVSPEVENGRTNGVQPAYRPRDIVVFECDPGYTLSGSPKTQCQDDGRWDPPVPVCERMLQCPSPPAITNGKPSIQASAVFTTGTSVNYSCEPGYSLTGQASIYCTASGTWSPPPPRCEEVLCITPEIQHGRKVAGHGPVYRPRDTVRFECDPGYTLNGSRHIQCRDDRTWNPPVPACVQALPCPPPPVIVNGKHNAKPLAAFPSGTYVNYSCEPDYALYGEASIYCTTSGTWSHPSPLCEEGCGVPTRLSFAELKSEYKNQSSFPVGKTINYSCLPGYSRHPRMQSTLTCLENRTWSEAFEFCKKKSCGHPGEPENGRVIITDIFFGSTVNFTCEEGHRLIGQPYRRCEISGTRVAWNGEVPICERILCSPPPDIPNGRRTLMKNYFYGSAVTYKCDSGYPLTGEASIHCTTEDGLNGVWSARPPRCGEVRCPVPQIQNGRRVSGDRQVYSYKDNVTFACDPGYTMKGHRLSQCQADDTWDPPLPVCEPATCVSPEVENGRTNGVQAAYRPRDIVVFECDPGYTLSGSPETQCQDDGRWEPPVPVCERMLQCPSPPAIANGKPSSRDLAVFTTGTSVNYSCEPGYSLTGQASIYCTASGTWSPPPPRCEEVLCIYPEIQHGRKVAGHGPVYRPRDTVRFECDPGYTLNGSHQIQCRYDGTWNLPVPVCIEATCVSPEVENGRTNGVQPAYRPRDIVVFECNPGYTLSGSPETQCQDDGRWDPPVPVCERTMCVSPKVENGRTNGVQPAYRPRDIIVFECNPGYTLSGSPETQCQDDGRWDPPVPVCERMLQCPSPPAIANGKPSSRDLAVFTTGTSVNYSCEPGYSLTGQASIYCTASGTWSPPPPQCEEILCIAPEIQHGRKVAGHGPVYRPKDTVRFECDPGYIVNGSHQIQCQDEGTWDPPVPVCIQATCVSPEVENGRTNGVQPAYRPRDIVVFECNPGYTLSGSPEAQCQDDGRWDPPVPVCERSKLLQCPSPPAITNGKPSGQDLAVFTSGMSVNYSCEPGYSLTGQASIYCTTSGMWSPPPPRCEEVLCIAPEIQHGRKIAGRGPVYRPRDTVRFECDPGYTLNGSRQIQCRDEGTWDPPVPACIQATCVSPEVENGRTNGVQPAYRPRDIVVFECDPGYTLSGSPETQCQDDGRWDPPVPVCERMLQCPSPPAIANGRTSGWDLAAFTTGTSVNYSCEPSYSLTGQASIYCTASGTWSPPPPRCEEVLCIAPEIQNGRKVSGHGPVYRPRDTVRFKCDPGYTLNGSRQIQCRDDRTWDLPVPVCIEALLCPPPPVIVKGKHNAKPLAAFPSGTYVDYSCEPGYALHGEALIYCTTSGTWSHPSPLCEEIRCAFPEVQGGKKAVVGTTYRFGTNVTLECDNGYVLEGSSLIQCQHDFTWDPPVPVCRPSSYNFISVVLGIAGGMLLLLLVTIIMWIMFKQNAGYYYTHENKHQIPLAYITEQKIPFAP